MAIYKTELCSVGVDEQACPFFLFLNACDKDLIFPLKRETTDEGPLAPVIYKKNTRDHTPASALVQTGIASACQQPAPSTPPSAVPAVRTGPA